MIKNFTRPGYLLRIVITPILLLTLLGGNLMAQSKTEIKGQVFDQKSGEGLPGVNIQIQRSNLGTTSDLEGYFQLNDLPPGKII